MKTKIVAALAALMFMTVTTAHAQNKGGYFGINTTKFDYTESVANGIDFSHLGTVFRAGYQTSPNFAIEGRVGIALGSDTITVRGVPIDFEVSRVLGIYARVNGSGTVRPYFLAGYSNVERELSGRGAAISESAGSFSWGIGLDAEVSEKTFLGVEYMNYYDREGIKVTGLGFAYTLQF